MRNSSKQEESSIIYVLDEIRERTVTDVTYRALDIELLKKYFPTTYKVFIRDRKLVKRNKGSKE